jgi:hypothetical protein
MRLLRIFFVKNQKREEERRRENVREGKSGVLSCRVILCDKLRCHIMSGGQKTRGFFWHWVFGASLQLIPGGYMPSTRSFLQM